jgi:hypothetical protein
MKYRDCYKTAYAENQTGPIIQLLQLLRIVHDGDIVNKSDRDWLFSIDLCTRAGMDQCE